MLVTPEQMGLVATQGKVSNKIKNNLMALFYR
jgi:hypothetical protein